MNRLQCPSCSHWLNWASEHVGKRAKCQKCGSILRIPSSSQGLESDPNVDSPLVTENLAPGMRRTLASDRRELSAKVFLSSRIVHRYSVNNRPGQGIGKVVVTGDTLQVHGLNKLLFVLVVGPFLGLITPIRKWMTNVRVISLPLNSIVVVADTSPRSYESMRIQFSDGQSCEFRLSGMGKAKLFDKMKGDIDKALAMSAGCILVETNPGIWEQRLIHE